MRRMIDTLFLNSLARQWAEQANQREQLANAAVYAADQSKRLFDERAALAEKMGATAFGTDRPLSDVQTEEVFAPRAQLGYGMAQAQSLAGARKNDFERALEEYRQQQQMARELTKGEFALSEETMRQAGQGERTTLQEGGRQFRWEGEEPVRSSTALKNRAMARYYNRKEDSPRGGVALPPGLKLAQNVFLKAAQHGSSYRSSGASAWNAVPMAQGQAEYLAAWRALQTAAQLFLPPEEAQMYLQSMQPILKAIESGNSPGAVPGGPPPGPGVSIPPQAPGAGEPALIESANSYEDYLRLKEEQMKKE